MPALMAGAHEEGAAGDRPADRALVDELAAGLMRAAKERVRRAADAQALAPCASLQERTRLGGREAERLFRVDVLAGREGLQPDLHMGGRDRQIDDDLDRRIREQRIDRHRAQPELGRPRLGRLGPDVGDAP